MFAAAASVATITIVAGSTPAGAEPAVPQFRARKLIVGVVGNTPAQASDSIVTGDLDEDGRDDVVALGYGTTATIRLSTGSPGSLGAPSTIGVGAKPASWHLVDVNGDDHLDLVIGHSTAGIYSFLGTGTGTFGSAIVSTGAGA